MCYELCTILIIQWRSACDVQNSGSLPHSNRICTKTGETHVSGSWLGRGEEGLSSCVSGTG